MTKKEKKIEKALQEWEDPTVLIPKVNPFWIVFKIKKYHKNKKISDAAYQDFANRVMTIMEDTPYD